MAHRYGHGTHRDIVLAYALYALASDNHEAAASNRRSLEPELSRAQLDEAQAIGRDWKAGTALPTRSRTGTSGTL